MSTAKQYAISVAGRYTFASPYHEDKRPLPFNITGAVTFCDEFPIEVCTVEFVGTTPTVVLNHYTLDSIQHKLQTGFLTPITQ